MDRWPDPGCRLCAHIHRGDSPHTGSRNRRGDDDPDRHDRHVRHHRWQCAAWDRDHHRRVRGCAPRRARRAGEPDEAHRGLEMGEPPSARERLEHRLLGKGVTVRAVARRLDVLASRGWQGAELATADALDPGSLTDVLANVDVAFYLVHSMSAGRNFGQLDLRAARNFTEAAGKAGIKDQCR